jgi:hypothetical protein
LGSRGSKERRVYDRGKISFDYDKVARLISLDPTAEIRFEYGDENFPPLIITSKTSVKLLPSFACSYGFWRRRAWHAIGVNLARLVADNF